MKFIEQYLICSLGSTLDTPRYIFIESIQSNISSVHLVLPQIHPVIYSQRAYRALSHLFTWFYPRYTQIYIHREHIELYLICSLGSTLDTPSYIFIESLQSNISSVLLVLPQIHPDIYSFRAYKAIFHLFTWFYPRYTELYIHREHIEEYFICSPSSTLDTPRNIFIESIQSNISSVYLVLHPFSIFLYDIYTYSVSHKSFKSIKFKFGMAYLVVKRLPLKSEQFFI